MTASWIRAAFVVADSLAAVVMAMVVTLAVRWSVTPGTDMVLAMLVGTAIGMLTHVVLGTLLIPLLGMFESMVPGMIVGMHGGMLFGMRRSMQHLALRDEMMTAVVFGITVAAGVTIYDRLLQARSRPVAAASEGPVDGHS